MNDEMKALAQRAVASKHWRWMPGMVTIGHTRVLWRTQDGNIIIDRILYGLDEHESVRPAHFEKYRDNLPDLTSPATLGCLLHLVRDAWSSKCFARPTHDGFTVMRGSGAGMGKISDGQTEAHALVAALEAAP